MSREIKFRIVIEEKHPPRWERKIRFAYLHLGDVLAGNFKKRVSGLPDYFTPPEEYSQHGGVLLLAKDEFTGRHDGSNKEVYEGDLVHYRIGEEYPAEVYYDERFSEYRLRVNGEMQFDKTYPLMFIKEVIGNIYENPRVLGV